MQAGSIRQFCCVVLMGNDEEGTFAALKACRRELINLKIAERRGRIVKTTGDSALVELASSVDATSCGVKIQRAIAERNASVPEVAGSISVSALM